jgi:ABC-2 type transport system ATP-binding protein
MMLQIKNLSKTINGKHVLQDLSFSIPQGSITGLVGCNGVGKSTLMRTIIGILNPTQGEVTYETINIHKQPSIKQKMIFVPDSTSMLRSYTVKEIVKVYKSIYKTFDEEYFYTLMERFSLPKGKINSYSKGMKALIQILLAFATKADIILLDEPTNGLDLLIKKQILKFIVEEVAKRNISVLISTHHLDEIEKIADTAIMLKDGKIEQIMTIEEIKNDYVKIQVAFSQSFPRKLELLTNITIIATVGRVHTVLIKGNIEETLQKFTNEVPLLLETLPMTLEDLFEHTLGGEVHVS